MDIVHACWLMLRRVRMCCTANCTWFRTVLKRSEISVMDKLGAVWRRGGEPSKLPKRDEHLTVVESLLAEVDFHIQELEQLSNQRRREETKQRTGVDYSWLVSEAPKVYKIPQLERLELEELCLKLEPSECSRVVASFRDSMLKEPRVEELARIMRSCVIQVLEQRPKSSSLKIPDWVNRRALSLVPVKLKTTRVGPADDGDIEMQAGEGQSRNVRAYSMPNFTVTSQNVTTSEEIRSFHV